MNNNINPTLNAVSGALHLAKGVASLEEESLRLNLIQSLAFIDRLKKEREEIEKKWPPPYHFNLVDEIHANEDAHTLQRHKLHIECIHISIHVKWTICPSTPHFDYLLQCFV